MGVAFQFADSLHPSFGPEAQAVDQLQLPADIQFGQRVDAAVPKVPAGRAPGLYSSGAGQARNQQSGPGPLPMGATQARRSSQGAYRSGLTESSIARGPLVFHTSSAAIASTRAGPPARRS